jgi:hypothetical protein
MRTRTLLLWPSQSALAKALVADNEDGATGREGSLVTRALLMERCEVGRRRLTLCNPS